MSIEALSWVIDQTGMKPSARVVLWKLCDLHDPERGCVTTQEDLSRACGIGRGTLIRHLQRLEDMGLIRRHIRVDDDAKHRLPTRYELAFEWEKETLHQNRTRGQK